MERERKGKEGELEGEWIEWTVSGELRQVSLFEAAHFRSCKLQQKTRPFLRSHGLSSRATSGCPFLIQRTVHPQRRTIRSRAASSLGTLAALTESVQVCLQSGGNYERDIELNNQVQVYVRIQTMLRNKSHEHEERKYTSHHKGG